MGGGLRKREEELSRWTRTSDKRTKGTPAPCGAERTTLPAGASECSRYPRQGTHSTGGIGCRPGAPTCREEPNLLWCAAPPREPGCFRCPRSCPCPDCAG